MDYEQKYKEVLKRAKQIHCFSSDISEIKRMEEFFPELKESSEDEKIKKALIDLVRCNERSGYRLLNNVPTSSMIAWLEKQCESKPANKVEPKFRIGDIIRFKGNKTLKGETETHKIVGYDNELYVFDDGTTDLFCEQDLYELVEQKPADKVEPKFHEGDWIVHQWTENIYQVVARIDNYYQLKYDDNYTIQNCVGVDRCARLWDITKDARDGDVLICENDYPFIYAGNHIYTKYLTAYCGITNDGEFKISDKTELWTNDNVEPANKEQRDLLFQKMKEAGYEWKDKKIIEIPKPKEPTGVLEQLNNFLMKKEVWSEEDEKHLIKCLETLIAQTENVSLETIDKEWKPTIDWLKQLKYRIK